MKRNKKVFNSNIAPEPQAETLDINSLINEFRGGKIDLICVLGPTASGKTRFAVNLAKQINHIIGDNIVEIISADSRQVYIGMDIGSGKDIKEYGDIPYHLINIRPAGYRYNVYEYEKDFFRVYKHIRSRGHIPILCGGTGLYIKAAVESYFDDNKPLNAYYIGTLVSREERVARIDRRLDARLAEGMIDEIKDLISKGVKEDYMIYYGLEYKFVTLFLQGELTYEQMRDNLAIAIHQFAKRQMTWFRGMERAGYKIHWVRV